MNTTTDHLLNRRVILKQPAEGYRVAIDPIFLAAAVPVDANVVLDVGCGVGAAMLCVAARLPACHALGVELQVSMVNLAHGNIDLNGWSERLSVIQADVSTGVSILDNKKFDYVITNPPFYHPKQVSLPTEQNKRDAHVESTADLEVWLSFCLSVLNPKGCLALIYPTMHLGRLLRALHILKCSSTIFPLWAGIRKPAKRAIMQIYKDEACKVELLSGLTLHGDDGRYTQEAEAILRGGEGICLA